jgi:hypothetical protein
MAMRKTQPGGGTRVRGVWMRVSEVLARLFHRRRSRPLRPYDLWYDPNSVGGDLVVICWISHGPRADDPTFDPQPGDQVLVGDDEEPPLRARVIRRDGERVTVQVRLDRASAVA